MKLPKKSFHFSKEAGFTLIELLLVIVIISTLAGIVYVALDPAKRIKDANDSKRAADIQAILTAVHQYIVDNKGSLPTGLTASMAEKQLGTSGSGCAVTTGGCAVTTAACLDLSTPLAKYLKNMPIDPKTGTAAISGYSVVVDANSIITVKACGSEGGTSIEASR